MPFDFRAIPGDVLFLILDAVASTSINTSDFSNLALRTAPTIYSQIFKPHKDLLLERLLSSLTSDLDLEERCIAALRIASDSLPHEETLSDPLTLAQALKEYKTITYLGRHLSALQHVSHQHYKDEWNPFRSIYRIYDIFLPRAPLRLIIKGLCNWKAEIIAERIDNNQPPNRYSPAALPRQICHICNRSLHAIIKTKIEFDFEFVFSKAVYKMSDWKVLGFVMGAEEWCGKLEVAVDTGEFMEAYKEWDEWFGTIGIERWLECFSGRYLVLRERSVERTQWACVGPPPLLRRAAFEQRD